MAIAKKKKEYNLVSREERVLTISKDYVIIVFLPGF